MQLMVAATLVLLCSRPLEVAMFEQVSWFLTAPSIAIIGREVMYFISCFFFFFFISFSINNEVTYVRWVLGVG